MDADVVYDPAMVDAMTASRSENIMVVDNHFKADDREEELVVGRDGLVLGLKRGLSHDYPDYVGGFVGLNRFSPKFMGALYGFMAVFFKANSPKYSYDRVLDALIQERSDLSIDYLPTEGLKWINVNYEEDYHYACRLVREFSAPSSPIPTV